MIRTGAARPFVLLALRILTGCSVESAHAGGPNIQIGRLMSNDSASVRSHALADDAIELLQLVWEEFDRAGNWPTFETIDRTLLSRDDDVDLKALIGQIPTTHLHGGRPSGGARPDPKGPLSLTVAGAAACSGTEQVLQVIITAARLGAATYRGGPAQPAAVTFDQVLEELQLDLSDTEQQQLGRRSSMLLSWEPWKSQTTIDERGGWTLELDGDIRLYKNVTTFAEYQQARARQVAAQQAQAASPGEIWAPMPYSAERAIPAALPPDDDAADPAYRLSTQEVRQLEILASIDAEAGQRAGVEVPITGLFDDQPTEERRSLLHDELEALEASGLIDNLLTPNNFGGHYCKLTPAGADRVERIRQLRADVPRRRRAARDVALRQLYDSKMRMPSTPALFYGESFSRDELRKALPWLHERGLITGTISASGSVFGAEISSSGEDWIEDGKTFDQATPGPQVRSEVPPSRIAAVEIPADRVITNHFYGSSNVAMNSTNVKQTVKPPAPQATDRPANQSKDEKASPGSHPVLVFIGAAVGIFGSVSGVIQATAAIWAQVTGASLVVITIGVLVLCWVKWNRWPWIRKAGLVTAIMLALGIGAVLILGNVQQQ
ncbi:hypothetical protein [Kribbella sp. NPDC051620]|uniref:hypothetical protein n=1 Tax=Kribbella sp. NPDC051620 TaxID=3364120 RepID=UPI00379F5711